MAVTLEDILKKRFDRYDKFDVMRWLVSGHKTITKSEEISLLSLLAYTAMENEVAVEDMQKAFLESFGIARVEQLRSDDYDDAVQFIMSWHAQAQSEAVAAAS
ncbi:MAG: hypothetical protein HY053_07475 [Proteobacteria bacterium]|nr:hypothetical protein [Pseudomonadota bacterium]